jgi:hypothetical protein
MQNSWASRLAVQKTGQVSAAVTFFTCVRKASISDLTWQTVILNDLFLTVEFRGSTFK